MLNRTTDADKMRADSMVIKTVTALHMQQATFFCAAAVDAVQLQPVSLKTASGQSCVDPRNIHCCQLNHFSNRPATPAASPTQTLPPCSCDGAHTLCHARRSPLFPFIRTLPTLSRPNISA
jgi:hypothetical protein